jgi:hypothetical protein
MGAAHATLMFMTSKFRSALVILGTLLTVLASAPTFAQWGWTDKDGRRIFSDQAPPSDVPDKSVFKHPKNMPAAAPAPLVADAPGDSAGASAPRAAASGLRISGKDSELEKKKKETDAEEAKKKKAEESKVAEARAENCQRAKRSLTQLQSGIRITNTNDKGEREFMGDAERAAEVKRLQNVTSVDCK